MPFLFPYGKIMKEEDLDLPPLETPSEKNLDDALLNLEFEAMHLKPTNAISHFI